LLVVFVVVAVPPAGAHLHALGSLGIRPLRVSPDLLRLALAARAAGSALDLVLVHGLERPAHAQEEHHQSPLRELCVVDQIRIDHVLEVAAAVVWEEDVDGLGRRV
jgi:hypothetical protein